jgi:S-methyl-5-thioribulose 1-phosphate isomerase
VRLRVTYQLSLTAGEDPAAKARDIALEQTVELPEGAFPPELESLVVGGVEELEPVAEGRWRAVISYDPVTVGEDVPQLLNLLFGNISLKSGIRITGLEWPEPLLEALGGPRYGVPGLREFCAVDEPRPLLCAALKPMGLSAGELADLCHQFALGGVDIIKDDHGLADQKTAPFGERVLRCQEAVTRANRETGGSSLYFPNITSGFAALPEHVEAARSAGCRGVLISPLLVGLDAVRWLAAQSGLAILAHPSFTGAFFQPNHGIAPEVLLGEIFRAAGSDGVIYPNAGGRFPFSEATCAAINRNLRKPLGSIRPAFPVPGGGMDVARVPYWLERYGADTIFLIGGSLYAQSDLRQASQRLLDTIRRHCNEQSIQGDPEPELPLGRNPDARV